MLQITVDTSIGRALGQLEKFSDRRMRASIATALTRTAKTAAQAVRDDMPSQVSNPTPYTQRGVRFQGATAQDLSAVVYFPIDRSGGQRAQGQYLSRIISGTGKRPAKAFEVALQARGLLPAGWVTVPGPACKLDSFGNISQGTIRTLLSSTNYGPPKPTKGKRSKGANAGQIFAVLQKRGRMPPGIYIRQGNTARAVLYAIPSATYKKTYNFPATVLRSVKETFPRELLRAVEESAARLQARND